MKKHLQNIKWVKKEIQLPRKGLIPAGNHWERLPLEAGDIQSNTYRTVFLRIEFRQVETAGFPWGYQFITGYDKNKVLPCIERDGVINGFDATLNGSSLQLPRESIFISIFN